MRFGSNSEFGAIDLLGSLVVNAGVTRMAAKQNDFRFGIAIKDKNNPTEKSVPGFLDYRFLAGAAAAVVGQTIGRNNAMVGRVAHDAASGLLNSFVATETMRDACMKGSGISSAAAPQGQLPAGAGPAVDMGGAYATDGNYAYGW